MNIRNILTQTFTILLLGFTLSSHADDIDIYRLANLTPDGDGPKPNVLFVLDNAASWSSVFDGSSKKNKAIHDALYAVLNNPLLLDTVNVGIMAYSQGNSPKGGKVIAAVKPLDSTHRDWISDMMYVQTVVRDKASYEVSSSPVPLVEGTVELDTTSASPKTITTIKKADGTSVILDQKVGPASVTLSDGSAFELAAGDVFEFVPTIDKTNNGPYALTFNEAYRYFKGTSPASGIQDGPQVAGDTFADDHYDPDAYNSATSAYNSPIATEPCANNFIIFIATGTPDSAENTDAYAELSALGGTLDSDPMTLTPDKYEPIWADEYTRYLKNKADLNPDIGGRQNITTYVIHVYDSADDDNPTLSHKSAKALLSSMGSNGGGDYFTAHNSAGVADAVTEVLHHINAVNDVFASVSLPVSVNVQGTHLNQIYIGVFRPDSGDYPRWFGNLKLYKFGLDSNSNLILVGADGVSASDQTTGFTNTSAVSFWTHDSSYWDFDPQNGRGNPQSINDKPDGEVVEKGAAAQQLREIDTNGTTTDDHTLRNVYTCISCSSGEALSSHPFNESNSAITTTLLGDASMSSTDRADLINWVRGKDVHDENGDGVTTDIRADVHGDVLHSRPVVIHYGGSEDNVYVFYGANDGTIHALKGGTQSSDGYEVWSFIPPEFFDKLKRLYDNDTRIADEDKPYFADGSFTAFNLDANNDGDYNDAGDVLNLYITMRRGGRSIYALDVKDPLNPKFLWKVDNSSLSLLGYTWSAAKLAYVNPALTSDPVIIMGAGYDPVDDEPSPSGYTMGNAVLYFNALTGSYLGHFPTQAPVPSEVALISTSNSAVADYAFVGDTRGNLYRIDMSSSSLADWTLKKIAQFDATEKFLYPPDVVKLESRDGYAVLLGSGNREDPKNLTESNHFYMIIDTLEADLPGVAPYNRSDLVNASGLGEVTIPDDKYGWYIDYAGAGEQTVGSAITAGGAAYFYTNVPKVEPAGEVTTCVPDLGTSKQYVVNYETGGQIEGFDKVTELDHGGLTPSPVVAVVKIGDKIYTRILTSPGNPSPPPPPGGNIGARKPFFWYKQTGE